MANSISLAVYTIRVRSLRSKENLKLHEFDVSCDLLQDFRLFLANFKTHSALDTQNQRRLICNNFNTNGRIIKGIIETGDYGYESSIVDVENDTETYRRKTHEAEMLPFYFTAVLPRNANEGLIALQRIGQHGIKTDFYNAFALYFIQKHPNFRVQFNEIMAQQVLDKLMNEGFIRKIRLIKFDIPKDIADFFDEGHREDVGLTEMVISAKRQGKLPIIPRLREILDGQRNLTNFIELENFEYQNVKVEFMIEGKQRVIDLSELDKLNAIYDITEDLEMGINGHPVFKSIDYVSQKIIREIYLGIGIGDEDVLQNQPHKNNN